MERSVYTEDDFRDYDESSYPWRKQNRLPTVDNINHHSCGSEIKGDSLTSYVDDVDGINIQSSCTIQSDCTIPDHSVRITGSTDPIETGQNGISRSCCPPQCGMNSNNLEVASCSAISMEKAERADPLPINDEEFATAIESHKCVSAAIHNTLNDKEHGAQDSSHLDGCAQDSNNIDEQIDSSHVARHCSSQDHTNHSNLGNGFAAVIVQDGTESSCSQGGCTAYEPISSCHFKNGLSEGVGKEDTETHELTTTLEKTVKNSLRSEQGNPPNAKRWRPMLNSW